MSLFGDGLSATSHKLAAFGRRALLRRTVLGGAALAAGAVARSGGAAQAAEASTPIDPKGEGFRRVVIGNNAQGKSYVFKDETIKRGEIWKSTAAEPLGPGGPTDPHTVLPASPTAADQPTAGTRWFYSALQPAKGPLDRATIKGWHRVSSVSYVLIANGEVTLVLDDRQVTLRGGDLLVMRNGMHTWHNATATPVGLLISQNLVS